MASRCPKCNGAEWYCGPEGDKDRAIQFCIAGALALALALGLLLQAFRIPMWPWWCFGVAAFILSQAALKWIQYAWRSCKACDYQTHDWTGRK